MHRLEPEDYGYDFDENLDAWLNLKRRRLSSKIRNTTMLSAVVHDVQEHLGVNSTIEPAVGLVFQPVLANDIVFTAAWARTQQDDVELLWQVEVDLPGDTDFVAVSPLDLRPNNGWYITVDEDDVDILMLSARAGFFRSEEGSEFLETYFDSPSDLWGFDELLEIYQEIRHHSEAQIHLYEIGYDAAVAWAAEADLI